MNIYVSHSRNFEYETELYEPLQRSPLAEKHHFIFPHELTEQSYPLKQLFLDKKCDLVLAEVSYPATGQGIELGWASMYEIPIICIYQAQKTISNSLKIISNTILPYQTLDSEFITKIEQNL